MYKHQSVRRTLYVYVYLFIRMLCYGVKECEMQSSGCVELKAILSKTCCRIFGLDNNRITLLSMRKGAEGKWKEQIKRNT